MITMNHECYVSLEVAKLLKETGFDWKVEFFYQNGILKSVLPDVLFNDNFGDIEYYYKHIGIPHYSLNYNGGSSKFLEEYSAPTIDTAQRWLRETNHLHITIFSSSQESWMFRITKPHQKLEDGIYGEDFYTYEEAQESGIKKALELILEKGE